MHYPLPSLCPYLYFEHHLFLPRKTNVILNQLIGPVAAFGMVKDQLIGYILIADRAGVLVAVVKGKTHLIDLILQGLFLLDLNCESLPEGVGISLVRSLDDSSKSFFVVVFHPCFKSHILLALPQLHLNLQ